MTRLYIEGGVLEDELEEVLLDIVHHSVEDGLQSDSSDIDI